MTFADRYDPAPEDQVRLETAIARRNTTWAHYEAATQLLRGAYSRYAGAELAPFIGNYNRAQDDWEWAVRDLVRERVRFRSQREIVVEDHDAYVVVADRG